LDQQVFQFTNNLNYVQGNHTFTIGFSFERFEFDNSFNLGAYGARGVFFPTIDISAFRDAVGDATATAALLADFQGQFDEAIAADNALNSAGQGNAGGFSLAETNVGQLAFYAQDDWNITDNFKLTYGARADKPLYFDTRENILEIIDRKGGEFSASNPGGPYQPGILYFDPDTNERINLDSTVLPENGLLFSPRVGFNWDVKGKSTTQLRGGTGVFTGRFPFVWLGNQVQATDFFFYQIVDPNFKWPQVWRSNIGVDHRLKNDITLSLDLSYTKDVQGIHVQNFALGRPTGQLQGFDDRAIYTDADIAVNEFGGRTNAFAITNSDEGRIFNATLKAQKTFSNGLYASLAYNYLDSKDVSSIDAEITSDAFAANAIVGDANRSVLANSQFGDTHRFVGILTKKFNYGKSNRWGTTLSAFYEYAQGGRFSYTYAGDLNNDGSNFNDLLYIPTAEELQQQQFSDLGQADAFEAFIQQDDYLSDNRGSFSERNGILAPWRGRWDIKFWKLT